MTEKAIWITVEGVAGGKELERVRDAFENTELSERYELIVSEDSIDTIDLSELEQLICNDG